MVEAPLPYAEQRGHAGEAAAEQRDEHGRDDEHRVRCADPPRCPRLLSAAPCCRLAEQRHSGGTGGGGDGDGGGGDGDGGGGGGGFGDGGGGGVGEADGGGGDGGGDGGGMARPTVAARDGGGGGSSGVPAGSCGGGGGAGDADGGGGGGRLRHTRSGEPSSLPN